MKNHSKTWRDFNPAQYAPGLMTKLLTTATFIWFVVGLVKAF